MFSLQLNSCLAVSFEASYLASFNDLAFFVLVTCFSSFLSEVAFLLLVFLVLTFSVVSSLVTTLSFPPAFNFPWSISASFAFFFFLFLVLLFSVGMFSSMGTFLFFSPSFSLPWSSSASFAFDLVLFLCFPLPMDSHYFAVVRKPSPWAIFGAAD